MIDLFSAMVVSSYVVVQSVEAELELVNGSSLFVLLCAAGVVCIFWISSSCYTML